MTGEIGCLEAVCTLFSDPVEWEVDATEKAH